MLSNEKRCYYQKNQLAEVICQLRFPQILSINTNSPAEFQELIREKFPKYLAKNENQTQASQGQPQPIGMNYQFSSIDNVWRVNLTSGFISLSTYQYTTWEAFAELLDGPLAAFIKIYKPACFERVGLRYMNFFSRSSLGLDGVAYKELFAPEFLGLMRSEDLEEGNFNLNSVDADIALGNSCRARIHAGPGLVKRNGQASNEVHFILDNDFYMTGNIPINYSAGALQTLHTKSYPVFRGAITDLLHNAMCPEQL
jgi:uncharacterized protein (TIGR04255 family)